MVLSGPAEYCKKSCDGEDEQVEKRRGMRVRVGEIKAEKRREAAQPDLGAWEEARTVYAWLRVELRMLSVMGIGISQMCRGQGNRPSFYQPTFSAKDPGHTPFEHTFHILFSICQFLYTFA